MQTITAPLASALKLKRDAGVLVTDILPGGPADAAGLKRNDIVLAVDGKLVRNLPTFMMAFLAHRGGEAVAMGMLRAGAPVSPRVMPVKEPHQSDRFSALIDPKSSEVPTLGIVVLPSIAGTKPWLPTFVRRTAPWWRHASKPVSGSATGLQVGDVIHELNGAGISTVQELKRRTAELKPGDAVALFIARERKRQHLAFEME